MRVLDNNDWWRMQKTTGNQFNKLSKHCLSCWLTQQHLPSLLFDSVHILTFNPVTSHATKDSHRLSRLTQSVSYHRLFTNISALASSLSCLCLCPPLDHSIHLGQLHSSLWIGLSASTGHASATMATALLVQLLFQTWSPRPRHFSYLVRLECFLKHPNTGNSKVLKLGL